MNTSFLIGTISLAISSTFVIFGYPVAGIIVFGILFGGGNFLTVRILKHRAKAIDINICVPAELIVEEHTATFTRFKMNPFLEAIFHKYAKKIDSQYNVMETYYAQAMLIHVTLRVPEYILRKKEIQENLLPYLM